MYPDTAAVSGQALTSARRDRRGFASEFAPPKLMAAAGRRLNQTRSDGFVLRTGTGVSMPAEVARATVNFRRKLDGA